MLELREAPELGRQFAARTVVKRGRVVLERG